MIQIFGSGFARLGYTFRPRSAKSRKGNYFTGFNPAVSREAQKRMSDIMRSWKLQQWVHRDLESIAAGINPVVQGWINYYGRFYSSALRKVLVQLNMRLVHWLRRKFKRYRKKKTQAVHLLGKIAQEVPGLFAHWRWGVVPTA